MNGKNIQNFLVNIVLKKKSLKKKTQILKTVFFMPFLLWNGLNKFQFRIVQHVTTTKPSCGPKVVILKPTSTRGVSHYGLAIYIKLS